MFSLILISKPFGLGEDGALFSLEFFEKSLKAAGFTVNRGSYPAHVIVTGIAEFEETLSSPNIFSMLGEVDVRRLESIKLVTDATFNKETTRLHYMHPKSLYEIQEGRDEDYGSHRGTQRWYLRLSDYKREMGEDGRVWGEAILKFQEMATVMLEEVASFKWASQIIALAEDYKNGRNDGALTGIVKKAEAIKSLSRREHCFPPVKKVKPGTILVDLTKPFPDEIIDQVVTETQSALGVRYIGRVCVQTPQFKLWPSEFEPEKWPDASVQERHTYLYFVMPSWQVTVELRLHERNTAFHSGQPEWKWSHGWGGSLRAIVPFTTPGLGFAGKDTHYHERLQLESHGMSWKQPGLGYTENNHQPIMTDTRATSGDYHAAFTEFYAGATWELNELGWEFIPALMNLLKRCWWGSNLLRYALPGKLMSIQEMFSKPDARFKFADCMDYFWQAFPIHNLLEFCEDKQRCLVEFKSSVCSDGNEHYRDFKRIHHKVKC